MRRTFLLPLLTLFFLLPACGGGNIGDLFSIFPPEAFEDPADPGDGGGIPGVFSPTEVRVLGGSQGVTGDVRNIVVATVEARTYAFITAQTTGVHVVDVTDPLILNSEDFVTTINESTLTSAGVDLAGGRVDALAVVNNTFLVCLAVGSGAPNAVTVFNIPALIEAATSPTADLSAAFLTPAGTGIAAPGNSSGNGGDVSGGTITVPGMDPATIFFVATGGADVISAAIDPDTGTWLEGTALDLGATIDEALHVRFEPSLATVYVSGRGPAGAYGIVSVPAVITGEFTPEIETVDEADFEQLDAFNGNVRSQIAGPGNFPLDIAVDTFTLLLTSNEKVLVYNIANPFSPSLLTTLENTGFDTISVTSDGGVTAIGAGDMLVVASTALGQARVTGQVAFSGTVTIRGVAIFGTDDGQFALCCGGEAGLRVVQLSETQQ